jgi:hypothetical protein
VNSEVLSIILKAQEAAIISGTPAAAATATAEP